MEENEAKEWIKYLGNQNLPYDRSPKSRKLACDIAIQALEEIQQYRAIGTVEQLEWCKDASHWKELFKEKLEKYEAIDTIEEFKALKEKNVDKKAEWKFDDFTAKFGNPYRCSNCDEEFEDTYNYCPNCGCDMYAD